MRSRLMVRFHLRQLNCRGFPLNVLNDELWAAFGQPMCLLYVLFLIKAVRG